MLIGTHYKALPAQFFTIYKEKLTLGGRVKNPPFLLQEQMSKISKPELKIYSKLEHEMIVDGVNSLMSSLTP